MNEIPNIVHYIWFGNNEKSELIKTCIESWKKYLPDWEFMEWNERNYDVNKSLYIKEAYESKKYAFAADYARFDILYKYGGVYFDTDVELLKKIPEHFMKYDGFTAVEGNNKIAPGLVFAVKPKNKIVKEIKDLYDKEKFIINGEMNTNTVVEYTTSVFKKYGFKENGQFQNIENIHVFPVEYFCAFDFDIREFNITKNTISIHHYTATWVSSNLKLKRKVQNCLKKFLGVKVYKKLLNLKRKFFGVSN
ncbi:MAG: glycosyltransferase [Clostridium perfringens]|nr:glycosyltransferase [Clostridium perfringens]